MPSTKVKGIIIESKDSKEKDKLVTIYTLEMGKVKAVFRGVRGEKAKLRASKDIFTFGDFFIENTKGNNIVSQVDVIESFYGISQDLDKYYEACSVIDVLKKLGTENSDPALFLQTIKALKAICFENIKRGYVLCVYLINIFKLSGYPLNLNICSSCKAKITGSKYINYDIGEILCANCKTYTCEKLSPLVVSTLNILNDIDYEKLNTLHLARRGEKEVLEVLIRNFEARFGYKIFVVL